MRGPVRSGVPCPVLRSFAGSVFWHTRGFRIPGWTARRTTTSESGAKYTALIGNTRTGADPPRNPGYEAPSCLRSCPAPALRRLSDVAESHQESHVGDADGFRGRGDVNAEHGAPNFKLKPVKASCSYYRLASRAFRGSTFWAFAAPSCIDRSRGGRFRHCHMAIGIAHGSVHVRPFFGAY